MADRRKGTSKTVGLDRRKSSRRRDDAAALGRATSLAAAAAPEAVPGKTVREEDTEIVAQMKVAVGGSFPTLFEMIDPSFKPNERGQYSVTADLYDATPRFWMAKPQPTVHGIMRRTFKHKDQPYHLELTPAMITRERKGVIQDIQLYPSHREEVIEMELVQMAAEKGVPWIDGKYGVQFTLRELQARLSKKKDLPDQPEKKGYRYDLAQLKEGLYVMARCSLTIAADNGRAVLTEPMLRSLGLRTWEEWAETGAQTLCYVEFNSLQIQSLKAGTWRLYDQRKTLSISNSLARWMYRRMSREWVSASTDKPMEWRLSSIIRDSGMQVTARLREGRRSVEDALDYLSNDAVGLGQQTIQAWARREEKGGLRGTQVLDVVYEIRLGLGFVADMKRRNQLRREALEQMASKKISLPPMVQE